MWKASWLSLQRFGIFVLWHVNKGMERREKGKNEVRSLQIDVCHFCRIWHRQCTIHK